MFESARAIARSLYHHRRARLGTSAPNPCFPTKAVATWHRLDYRGHVRIVHGYLEEVGNFADLRGLDPAPEVLRSALRRIVHRVVARAPVGVDLAHRLR